MNVKIFVLICTAFAAFSNSIFADTLFFKSGEVIQGYVLQTNGTTVLIQREFGTYNYPANAIREIKKTSLASEKTNNGRIATWSKIISDACKQPWAYGAKQIPATVIDNGIFENVPYSSFRLGSSYELNIYGDPQSPAAVEIGLNGALIGDSIAKENCFTFISSILSSGEDRELIRKLDKSEDVASREGLVFEVTAPTAVDAYGAWWLSVYDEEKLNKARASKGELKQISEPIAGGGSKFNPNDAKWTAAEKKEARTIRVVYLPVPVQARESEAPAKTFSSSSYSGSSSSRRSTGGSVYVRSYYRKDGTYVRAHTRRKR